MSEVQTAAGRRLRYDEWGAGPPVLLLQGAFAGRRMWAPTAEALAPRHRVLALDNRDAGESDAEPTSYTMDDLAGDAVALLDALGIARAHVVGASTGGMIAVHAAANHPARVGRLVLIATPAPVREWGADPPTSPPPWWAADPAERWRRLTAPLLASQPGPVQERLAVLIALDAGNRIDLAGVRRQQQAMAGYHRLARFRQVRAPTLVIGGALDHPEAARALAEGISGARLLLLPETGHLVLVQRPAEASDALLDFLAAPP
jgi:pimeloyl-ACP methyl ester carboxylesterase